MTILLYFLVLVEVVCSLLLIGVILLQKTKGQGVGLAFGAGMGESLFGAQMGNVLTKTTVVLGIVFLVNTTLISLLQTSREAESAVDAAPIQPAAPALPGSAGSPADAVPTPAVEATVPIEPIGEAAHDAPATAEEVPAPAE